MKNLLALLITFLFFADIQAQEVLWSRTYGGDRTDGIFGITKTNDGGIVMAGFSSSFSTNHIEDVYLLKTGSDGNQVWSRTYGTGYIEIATDIKQTSDGGYIVSGYKQVSNVNDPFLMKTDSEGNLIWENTYDNGFGLDDRAHAVYQTSDGGYILAGQTRIVDQFAHYDMYVVRTDASGNLLWKRLYGYTAGSGNDAAMSVLQLSDGGFIIGGFTQSSIWSSYVIRTNASGDVIWIKVRPDDYQSECYNIIKTLDGNLLLTGTSVSFETDTDVLVEKLDMNGNQLWEKIYGGENAEMGQCVREIPEGGFVISGMASTLSTGYDMYVMQLNLYGDSLWTKRPGGTSDDRGYAVELLNDGSIITAGWVHSFGAGGGDAYALKFSKANPSAISQNQNLLSSFKLYQNYPNPFNPTTRITYEIKKPGYIELKINDVTGKEVSMLVSKNQQIGTHSEVFHTKNLPTGVYYYSLFVDGIIADTKKCILLK